MAQSQAKQTRGSRYPTAAGFKFGLAQWMILLMIIAAVLCFVATALAVERGWMDPIDDAILQSMGETVMSSNPWGPSWFEETVVEISALGGYPVIVLATAIAGIVLWLASRRSGALLLVAALSSGALASTLLKLAFDRSRPDFAEPMDRTFTASFPSGHAMISMVSWLTLAVVVSCYVPQRALRVFILCSAFFLAIIIGLSRVYLGVHWPSDVFAGWCIGLAWAGTAWLIAHSKIGVPNDRVY